MYARNTFLPIDGYGNVFIKLTKGRRLRELTGVALARDIAYNLISLQPLQMEGFRRDNTHTLA